MYIVTYLSQWLAKLGVHMRNCSVGGVGDVVGVMTCKKHESRLDCDDVEIRK